MSTKVSAVAASFRLLACVVIFRQQDFIVPLQVWLNVIAFLFAVPEVIILIHAAQLQWKKQRFSPLSGPETGVVAFMEKVDRDIARASSVCFAPEFDLDAPVKSEIVVEQRHL